MRISTVLQQVGAIALLASGCAPQSPLGVQGLDANAETNSNDVHTTILLPKDIVVDGLPAPTALSGDGVHAASNDSDDPEQPLPKPLQPGDPDDPEQPLPNPFPPGEHEPFPIPNLNRLVYSCPIVEERNFGMIEPRDDLTLPPNTDRCALSGVTVLCKSRLSEEDQEACRKEFLPIARRWVHEHFTKKAAQAKPLPSMAKKAIESYGTALANRCESDIGNANDITKRFSDYVRGTFTFIGPATQAALEALTDADALNGLNGNYENDGVLVKYYASDDGQSMVAEYTFSELPDGLDEYLATVHGSARDEFSVGRAHATHIGVPYRYMETIFERHFQKVTATKPVHWDRNGGRGRTGKLFGAVARLPEGYKHCETVATAGTFSSQRVCETRVTPSWNSVELEALIRGRRVSHARGWLRGSFSIVGIDERATRCEMERYGCTEPLDPYSITGLNTAQCHNSIDHPSSGRRFDCKVNCACVLTEFGMQTVCSTGTIQNGRCVPNGGFERGPLGYCSVD